MAEIDVLKAQIVRQDLNTAWGFVLQGGADQGTPLTIHSLAPGSPGARIGLKPGDEVTEIGDLPTEGLTYHQVQELVDRHGDTLILTVERRARGSVPVNPMMNATEGEHLKDYQTYDMAGAQQQPQPHHHQQQQPTPAVIPVVFEKETPLDANAAAEVTEATPADVTAGLENDVPAETTPEVQTETPTVTSAPSAESVMPEPVVPEPVVAPATQLEGDQTTPAVIPESNEVAPVPQHAEQEPTEVVQSALENTQIPAEVAEQPQSEVIPAVASAAASVQAPPGINQAPAQVVEETPVYQQHAPVQSVQEQAPITQQPNMAQSAPRSRTRVRPTQHAVPAGPISQIVMGQQSSQFVPSTCTPSQPEHAAHAPVPMNQDDASCVAVLRNPEQAPMPAVGALVVSGGPRRRPQPVEAEPSKLYQTYDMNGPRAYQPGPPAKPCDFQFETVRARPFEDQPRPYYRPQQQSPPTPLASPPRPQPPPQPQYAPPPQQYSPRGYDYQDYPAPAKPASDDYSAPARPAPDDEFHPVQSRTFNVLQSLMSSEEPAAGVQGLPPQRSISQEKWKAEQESKRGSPRVKVFMPQQYNSPLGMYSAKNVVETFQAQAETVMDAIERYPGGNTQMSAVQRALMES